MPDETTVNKNNIPAHGPTRVLIAAGGTGGHIYPAIAIADELKNMSPDLKIKFVGSKLRMEWDVVPKAGYKIKSIWISGFHRRLTIKNLIFPIKLAVSLIQSWKILSSFKPDAIISCGGFVAGPPGWVAEQRGIPLFIQEQNSFPGITNRILAKKAQLIFTAFKDADRYFPAGKTSLTGNPTRQTLTDADPEKAYEHFSFASTKPTLLVLGGSGGARSINEAVAANLDELHNKMELQIIWQCGRNYINDIQQDIDVNTYNHLRLTEFLNHMAEAYEAADIVVSRAGALTCSELAVTGNAGILVPSPNVAGNHQAKNARSLVNNDAALLLEDDKARAILPGLVKELMADDQKRLAMQQAASKLAKPEAAQDIVDQILQSLSKNKTNV